MSSESLFEVKESPEGGYEARSKAVRDSVLCHFEQPDLPKAIRLHFVKDEGIAT